MVKPQRFIKALVRPVSLDADRARREFILHTLLLGLILLSATSFIFNTIKYFITIHYHGLNPLISGLALALFCYLLVLSKRGGSYLASSFFILLIFLGDFFISFHWGPDLPESLLLYSLLVVITSILLDSKKGMVMSAVSGALILVFAYLKVTGILHTEDRWRFEAIHFTDALTYGITLGIIALVSWLFNREMERALKRAYRSEAALRGQKEKLEVLVAQRTKQLRETQIEKVTQLYRFAEFGRSASGLFHDLVNPLTVVSLNLNRMSETQRLKKGQLSDTEVALERAIVGTKRLESFVQAARKQFQNQEIFQKFSPAEEITQAAQMLAARARERGAEIDFNIPEGKLTLFGNPIKFNQVVTNLISNAIDAYKAIERASKKVEVRLRKQSNDIVLQVQDWGSGIADKHLHKIFEPLFTTKGLEEGTGIGLSISKDIVEKHFQGSIKVESKEGEGTTFTVNLPIKTS